MGNGEALAKLCSAHRSFVLFIEHHVCVVVESFHIGAGQEQRGISGAAEVEFGGAAIVHAMEVTDREGRLGAVAWAYHGLRSQEYFGDTVCALARHTVVDDGCAV